MAPEVSRTADDFLAAALQRVERSGSGANPGLMADWLDGEVLAALDQTATDAESLLEYDGGIRGELFEEYLRRDFDAALTWFRSQDFL